MTEIALEEVKEIGFHTLEYFADFCDSHRLTYYVAYGTLIGAVRHRGFIPWDDDIDTWMPRKDYDKLLSLRGEINGERYALNAIEVNPDFLSLFAKLTRVDTVILPSRFTTGYVYGSSIDIFPLDAIGKTDAAETVRREYMRLRAPYENMTNRYHPYTDGRTLTGWKKIAKKAVYRFAEWRYGPLSEHMRRYARLLADNNPDEYDFYTTLAGTTLFKKEWFRERVKLDFESAQFYAPIDYDAILRARYGNYMEYPPENERVLPHSFKAYYLDKGEMGNLNVP